MAVITRGMPKRKQESAASGDVDCILNPANMQGLSYLKIRAEKEMTEEQLEHTLEAMAVARARYEAHAVAAMDVLEAEIVSRKCAHAQLVVLMQTFGYFTKREDLQTLIEALDIPLGKSMVAILQGDRIHCERTADTEIYWLHFGDQLGEIQKMLLRASRDRHVHRAFCVEGAWDVKRLLFLFESIYDADGDAFCEDVEAVCRLQLEACGSSSPVQGALLSGLMDFKDVLLQKSDGKARMLDKLDALLGRLRVDF